jgi:hypothetical protein
MSGWFVERRIEPGSKDTVEADENPREQRPDEGCNTPESGVGLPTYENP